MGMSGAISLPAKATKHPGPRPLRTIQAQCLAKGRTIQAHRLATSSLCGNVIAASGDFSRLEAPNRQVVYLNSAHRMIPVLYLVGRWRNWGVWNACMYGGG